MKRKVPPRNQTEELNRARLEFLTRNPEEFKKVTELLERDLKYREELATRLATVGDKPNPKLKESWDFLLAHIDGPFDAEFAAHMSPQAVNAVWRWLDYSMEVQGEAIPAEPGKPDVLSYEELKPKVMDCYARDARQIFTELTNDRPGVHLLLGVDLTRNKGVIFAEVERLVTEYQRKMGVNELPEKRLKWLASVDELVEVLDLYAKAGQQPSKTTFRQIARKVKRPLSTVRDQWHAAHRWIYGTPYDPETKYATEDKRRKADELCAKCPHGAKCYRGADWFPCADYLRLSGKERKRTAVPYIDEVGYPDP